ncbi:hypothetical protein LOTGIDRAFT_157623 [Lottia gigantea]|uniref:Ig-like domain-containing protein n=1 Tax=Lottia gigantea TaxID=225164 RepID=V4ABT7_LOTGI|nr:hypothetical protein LOTGIDRAFT_157623 [Lottia gigantea]ESP01439.1 hypothetical protein LOTGIDRAFT_157623 [Lottia gigantea]
MCQIGASQAKIPKIKRIKDQKKREGQKIRIRCSAKAKPRAIYSWYKDDVLLTRRKGLNIKNGKRASRLQINRVKKSDVGRYKCIASNAAGEEEAFFRIEDIVLKNNSNNIVNIHT